MAPSTRACFMDAGFSSFHLQQESAMSSRPCVKEAGFSRCRKAAGPASLGRAQQMTTAAEVRPDVGRHKAAEHCTHSRQLAKCSTQTQRGYMLTILLSSPNWMLVGHDGVHCNASDWCAC